MDAPATGIEGLRHHRRRTSDALAVFAAGLHDKSRLRHAGDDNLGPNHRLISAQVGGRGIMGERRDSEGVGALPS